MVDGRGQNPTDKHSPFPAFVLGALVLVVLIALAYGPGSAAPNGYASALDAPKPTETSTATATATATATRTPTPTGTATSTALPTGTPTSTATATSTLAATGTSTPTGTATATTAGTATSTAQVTETPTPTGTTGTTNTPTPTATAAGTGTPTPTATPTATATLAPGAVPNDDFNNATVISSFPFSTTKDVTKATEASDDPPMGVGTGNQHNTNTVWFTFVPASGGGLHVSTIGSSSDFDTVVAAFSGGRGSLSLVANNDDASPGVIQSETWFNVQAGQRYFLEVARYTGASGGSQLTLNVELGGYISATAEPTAIPTYSSTIYSYETATPEPTTTTGPAPSNDDIGSAVEIGGLPFTDSRDTTGATVASDDPNMGTLGVNSNTVWYHLVAASNGSVQADTTGSNYDTVMAADTGSRGSLSSVASNDDLSQGVVQSRVSFNVQSGQGYYLEVAQYGSPAGGQLTLNVTSSSTVVSTTPTAVVAGTTALPAPVAPGVVLGVAPGPIVIPPPARVAGSTKWDERYFQLTGYRVDLDPFWDYFQKRGGVRTFGYPVSWEFRLHGFRVQFFQRGILQLMPDGGVAAMNLLDQGLMPYNVIKGSTFPQPEKELIDSAPSPVDPLYADKAIAFLNASVPDEWDGMPVGFLKSYLSTVRYEDAFPNGDGDAGLIPLFDLEVWGLPTSRPVRDPNNQDFVYQRFQRGILHYDAATGVTQGLLLADYLKSIMTGQNLPADLAQQVSSSPFYRQYDPTKPGSLARPAELPGTNLEGAFEKEQP